MNRLARRVIGFGLGVPAALLSLAAIGSWLALRASLPQVAGESELAGLTAPVSIERDALGVPMILGETREDVARATGYVHAQDRLFQMDLLRRTGAGELSALLGPALLERDRRIRLHQFRKRAVAAIAGLAPGERALLEAYADGANAALAAMAVRPFEYLLLRERPRPWRPEDSLLVAYAQWIELQGLEAQVERRNGRLAAALPAPLYRLVTEPDPAWEAPLDGSRLPEAPMPSVGDVDLRRFPPALFEDVERRDALKRRAAWLDGSDSAIGSNNWAVAGPRTAGGGALLANDMHLRLRVPNVWYRARLVVEADGLDITGVGIPGLPLIVAGSNGHVAWGFTNSYGDFQDLVVLERGPDGPDSYLTADGPRRFETDVEVLAIAGGDSEPLIVRRTIWGPVIGANGAGRELALAWTADRPGANDLAMYRLESARDLDGAAAILRGAGMPAQNVMIADARGRIGWVLSGRLPLRRGFDSKRPAAWHTPGVGWAGWIAQPEAPQLLDPPQGIAWTANARVVGGEDFVRIGDGSFAAAARARQIRARLERLNRATPADMLAIQLDDRADYLAHWQPLLLGALERLGAREAAGLVSAWSGHAAVGDAGYRLVREFERQVSARAFSMLTVVAQARWPGFNWQAPPRFTETAWRLLRERPAHLLDPRFADWDAWLASIAAGLLRTMPPGCVALADCAWGKVNTAAIQHPLSLALPRLAPWLDMPADPLPGDWSTPRVQSPDFGASERFVVSPGREEEGLLHMPGGQSGHPLSPYYRAGHDAWVRGEPTPFRPGDAEHVLRLVPSVRR